MHQIKLIKFNVIKINYKTQNIIQKCCRVISTNIIIINPLKGDSYIHINRVQTPKGDIRVHKTAVVLLQGFEAKF